MQIVWMRCGVAAIALLLGACGGGGGGSGGNGGGSSAATGLVPAAPPVGAIIHADALTLRPVQMGARWNYRGTVAATGRSTVAYLTTTTQSSTSSVGATEATSNAENTGPDTQTLLLSGGVVSTPTSIDFTGKGTPDNVNIVELRSPVRVGDQYTIFDKQFADIGTDVDGDGKPDKLDVAIYASVAGTESVSLPNLPAMQAVRVDTVLLVRATASSTGQQTPVVRGSTTTWYVAGIGIVRHTTNRPDASSNEVLSTDEQIESWDGVNTGLGAMKPVAAVIPTGNGVFAGQALPGGTSELLAFGFAEHALVLTDTPGLPSSTLASRIDLRGKVLSANLLTDLRMNSNGTAAGHANGVVYLEPLTGGAVSDFGLTRVDANGVIVGAVRGVTLSLGGTHVSSYVTRLTATMDGSTLWLLWARPYYDPGNGNLPGDELVLRPYSLDGLPLGPEVIMDTVVVGSLNVVAGNGQVLMTWVREIPGHDVMFGSASLTGSARARPLATGLASSNSLVTPLSLGANGALMWPAALGTGSRLGAAAGVLLGANLTPVRAGADATLLDEQIAGMPMYDGSVPGPAALGSRLVVTATQTALLWPSDTADQSIDAVSWLDTSSVALASTPVSAVRIAAGRAKRQVVYADRVLVFGGNAGLTTTVVWLNNGR